MTDASHPAGDWREAAKAEYAERRSALMRQHEKALKTLANLQKKLVQLEVEISDLDKGAQVFGFADPDQQSPPSFSDPAKIEDANAVRTGKQFKDVALELLAEAYPKPLKAAQVQEGGEKALARQFHWKTSGMTLYRLSKEGKVRRQGQSWFYVPPGERRSQEAEADGWDAADQQDGETDESAQELQKRYIREALF